MKTKAILFINGTGGHKEQMKRFISLISIETDILKIGICEKQACLSQFDECVEVIPVRDKHSHLKSVVQVPYSFMHTLFITIGLMYRYDIKGIISTGPGIALFPSLIFRLFGKKVVFIETWSRFKTQSYTARAMYKVANKFYIQNKSLKKLYENSIYSGRL